MNMFTIFFQKTNSVWHKNSYVHSIDFKPAEFELECHELFRITDRVR